MKVKELFCVLITALFLGILAHEFFHLLGGGQAICLGQTTNPSISLPLGSLFFVVPGQNFNSFFGNELIAFLVTGLVSVLFILVYLKVEK